MGWCAADNSFSPILPFVPLFAASPSPNNQKIHTDQRQSLHNNSYSPASVINVINSRRPVRQSVSSPYSSHSSYFRSPLPARLEAGRVYTFSPKEVLQT